MEIIKHPIKPAKANAWHNFVHPYFTKQPSNVVHEYIKHYTKKGETVLDPFCGTGVTAIEALALGRKAIMIDLNPLACFITDQTVKQIDIRKLKSAFVHISDTVGKTIMQIDGAKEKDVSNEKIPFWYPKKISMPSNADFDSIEQLWTHKQLIGLSILFNAIKGIQDEDIRDQMKFVFSATLSTVNLTYMPSERDGKKVGGGGPSIFGTYRYWRPKKQRELPLWDYFERRFRLIARAKEEWNDMTQRIKVKDNFELYNGSVLELTKYVKKDSIDYVYTDPPYGGNIAYLDLSIMWNAWLGFEVDGKMRGDEIIEGGDLEKSKENYEELFTKSFEQIGKVLKKRKWMSLVFAHKKLEFWNTIIDGCEENGMEFKGSTFQPTNNSSVHYKKNPANVLCSQRIANFEKTYKKSPKDRPDNLQGYILNEIERTCMELNGAELDKIYQSVLDRLHNNHVAHEAKKKGLLNLNKVLDDHTLFVFDKETNRYFVKSPDDKHKLFEKQYYENKDEVKMYLRDMLKTNGSMTLDSIHKELFDVFKSDIKFPIEIEKDLVELLNAVAYKSKNTNKWVLKESEPQEFDFRNELSKKLVKITSPTHSHSDIIFRLAIIGNYLGFRTWIGKREQGIESYEGIKFKDLSLSTLPMTKLTDYQKKKIQQIDVIWFDKLNIPRYAFEIEQHTAITSGFERFAEMLEVERSISNKLFIVAPKSRRRKLEEVFTKSNYIGHPNFLENKVHLIFNEDLVRFYDQHLDKEFDESNLRILQHSFNE